MSETDSLLRVLQTGMVETTLMCAWLVDFAIEGGWNQQSKNLCRLSDLLFGWFSSRVSERTTDLALLNSYQ